MWQYIENVLSKEIIRYQVPSDTLSSRKEFEDVLCQLISSVDKTTVVLYMDTMLRGRSRGPKGHNPFRIFVIM